MNAPFMVCPPVPNITGALHLGHALNLVLQDVLVRLQRHRGSEVCWPVGTDHAGLAGQYAAERACEVSDRRAMGRARFETLMRSYHRRQERALLAEMRSLALAADWDTVVSTYDSVRNPQVTSAFVEAHARGHLYRADALVNWCPRCESCISDMELSYEHAVSDRYELRLSDDRGEKHTLSTLFPELVGVAEAIGVHPGHPRASRIVGRAIRIPGSGRPLRLERAPAREGVDPTTLTLVVPGFNADDFDRAHRAGRAVRSVFDEAGRIEGESAEAQRKAVLARWKAEGLVAARHPYSHGHAHHVLCGQRVVPRVAPQWFFARAALAEHVDGALRGTRIRPEPWQRRAEEMVQRLVCAGSERVWSEGACFQVVQGYSSNRDFVVSRQHWWGHPVPAAHCEACGDTVVSPELPERCSRCGGRLVPTPDVIDVFFSGSLWPATVSSWPDRHVFGDLCVLGADVLLWVAATALFARYFHGKPAFADVVMHPLVCDAQGRKMSKSLHNGVELQDAIARFGAEPVRGALLWAAGAAAREDGLRLPENAFEQAAERLATRPAHSRRHRAAGEAEHDVLRTLDAGDVGRAYQRWWELSSATDNEVIRMLGSFFHPTLPGV